jgi:hypothetical protein
MALNPKTLEVIKNSMDNQTNSYLSDLITQAQKREEEQFKREYLCKWIVDPQETTKNSTNYANVFEKVKELSGFWDEPNKNNIMEEKQMNVCEFKLGDVAVIKTELDVLESGEVIILAPGYINDDFTVNEFDDKVTVVIKLKDGTYDEYVFELNTDYELATLKRNVRDGVFRLKGTYTLENNVEIDKEL